MTTWPSRRPNVLGTKGALSCDQPLAAHAGLKVLDEGGTAADAAVAMAGVMSVTQPATCGLGGDVWVLYYDAQTKHVHCLNGHGRTPAAFTRSNLERLGHGDSVPSHHAVCTGIPGAPAAFCDLHQRFGNGKFTLRRLLDPAIRCARDGFPVSEVSAHLWKYGYESLKGTLGSKAARGANQTSFSLDPALLNPDGTTPKQGQIFRMPDMARSLEEIANGGADAYYKGRIAKAIVDCQQRHGGLITLEDLAAHKSDWVEPIKIQYRPKNLNGINLEIYQTPLNSQGIVVLEALQIMAHIDQPENYLRSPDHYYHAVIESLKFSFADVSEIWRHAQNGIPPSYGHLLHEHHAATRAKLFNPRKASVLSHPMMFGQESQGDTTYFALADQYGNGCSVVYSNYWHFGTGYVPQGCGFTLNNRVYNVWEFQHRRFTPSVRPFTTLTAGMITQAGNDDLAAVFGCMGGQKQPQLQLQILLNLLEFGETPQQSLDHPRMTIEFDYGSLTSRFDYEKGIPDSVVQSLQAKGHKISEFFDPLSTKLNCERRGSIITRGAWWDRSSRLRDDNQVLWTACDGRSDGVALVL